MISNRCHLYKQVKSAERELSVREREKKLRAGKGRRTSEGSVNTASSCAALFHTERACMSDTSKVFHSSRVYNCATNFDILLAEILCAFDIHIVACSDYFVLRAILDNNCIYLPIYAFILFVCVRHHLFGRLISISWCASGMGMGVGDGVC